MKMNSLTDMDFIRKVSEASNAGVKVDLIVRGICCILPGIPGYTENIRVMSIVGRYLEHPRIFCFGTGAEQKIYIGSADMMTRNTEKRVEVACPIYDKEVRAKLHRIMDACFADNVKARVLQSDGTYALCPKEGAPVDSQQLMMDQALRRQAEGPAPEPEERRSVFRRLRGLFSK